jgi:hypothetical protein
MRERLLRLVLLLGAAANLAVGLWALVAPRSFYDDFPGGGRSWVSPDGPFNEHLVRDVGGLNLGLAIVAIVAAATLAPVVVRTAAVAALVFGIPHLVYHSFHTDLYATADAVGSIASLSLGVVLPVLALLLVRGSGAVAQSAFRSSRPRAMTSR